MPTKQKKFLAAAIAVLAVISVFAYFKFAARGSGYGWLQTDWSGGASTTAVAAHASDQAGWDKYYSKDGNVVASTTGELSLASTTATWTDTDTDDFSAGTASNAYVSAGTVALMKPLGVSCSANSECSGGWCNAGYCGDCSSFTYGSSTYPVVIIGTQCWMASNLNIGVYATSTNTGLDHSDVTDNSIIEKYCYNNTESNCATYGGLYDWNEAMGYVTTAGAQGICQTGWHIPTDAEQHVLENYLKDDGQTCDANRSGTYDCATAGAKLKSGGSAGFGGLLAGYRYYTGSFNYLSSNGYFWSSSEYGSGAWRRYLYTTESRVYRNYGSKSYGYSVRCLKN